MQIPYCVCSKVLKKGILRGKAQEIGEILRTLCDWKKIKIIEAEVRTDHVHMLVEIPPKSLCQASWDSEREKQYYDLRKISATEI